ncbi:MAG: hypothetical protein R6X25_12560 [Candidatus Krumholzibacteriia bacterium]
MKRFLDRHTYELDSAERERMWQTVSDPLRHGHLPPEGGDGGAMGRWLEEMRPFIATGVALTAALLLVGGTLRTFLTDRPAWRDLAERNQAARRLDQDRDFLGAPNSRVLYVVFEGVTDGPAASPDEIAPAPVRPAVDVPAAELAIRIRDAETGERLDHASALLAAADGSGITPLLADGASRRVAVGTGQRLRLSHLGYAARETVLEFQPGQKTVLDLALLPIVIATLGALDVEGDAVESLPPPAARPTAGVPYASPGPADPPPTGGAAVREHSVRTGVHRLSSPPAPRAPAPDHRDHRADRPPAGRLPRAVALHAEPFTTGAPLAAVDPGFPPAALAGAQPVFHAEGALLGDAGDRAVVRLGVQVHDDAHHGVMVDFLEGVAEWRRLDGTQRTHDDFGETLAPVGGAVTPAYVGLYEVRLTPAARTAVETATTGAAERSPPVRLVAVTVPPGPRGAAMTTADLVVAMPRASQRLRLAYLTASLREDLTALGAGPAAGATARRSLVRRLAEADSLAAGLPPDAAVQRVRAWLARAEQQFERHD